MPKKATEATAAVMAETTQHLQRENSETYTLLGKEKRIKKEYERLKHIFKDFPKPALTVIDSLLQNSAFMKVTLDDLQACILYKGAVDVYQNGKNQYGTKASAELQSYNALVKNYSAVQHKLIALLETSKTDKSLKTAFDKPDSLQDQIDQMLKEEDTK